MSVLVHSKIRSFMIYIIFVWISLMVFYSLYSIGRKNISFLRETAVKYNNCKFELIYYFFYPKYKMNQIKSAVYILKYSNNMVKIG